MLVPSVVPVWVVVEPFMLPEVFIEPEVPEPLMLPEFIEPEEFICPEPFMVPDEFIEPEVPEPVVVPELFIVPDEFIWPEPFMVPDEFIEPEVPEEFMLPEEFIEPEVPEEFIEPLLFIEPDEAGAAVPVEFMSVPVVPVVPEDDEFIIEPLLPDPLIEASVLPFMGFILLFILSPASVLPFTLTLPLSSFLTLVMVPSSVVLVLLPSFEVLAVWASATVQKARARASTEMVFLNMGSFGWESGKELGWPCIRSGTISDKPCPDFSRVGTPLPTKQALPGGAGKGLLLISG